MNLADDKKSKNYIISWEEIATIPIIANIGLKVLYLELDRDVN